jgi:STE24 endopeptidase
MMFKFWFATIILSLCLTGNILSYPFKLNSTSSNHINTAASASSVVRVPVPEPSEKALKYHHSGNIIWILRNILSAAIPLVFLITKFSAILRNWAQKIGRRWFFILTIYLILFLIFNFLLELPFSYYTGFVRQHEYGLSNQTSIKWWSDTFKNLCISLILSPLVIWIPYLLLKKSPQRWWLYTGLTAIPIVAIFLLVEPIWIEPLFSRFGPMKDKVLEQKIRELAQRAKIGDAEIFEVDKSVDTKAVNAYVAGLLNTKRIVLWDTIIKELSDDQLLFVVGHEMGHYVLGHVVQIVCFSSIFIIVGLYLVHRSADILIRYYGSSWGFSELADIASLPLIILLFSVAIFLMQPFILAITRHNEHEADRFGIELTQNNFAAATAFAKLQKRNLSIPRPGLLYKLWRSTHPPIGERIDFLNSYRPWETGEPLRYREKTSDTADQN